MTKRERIEDLGIILTKLEDIIHQDEQFNCPWNDATSKHTRDSFVEKYRDRDKMEDLHDWIRSLRHKLDEIWCIARGDDE